jgi:short-subunit dehydrogenase
MAIKLKNIEDQTMVITGATSGIGLCTARTAAARGANVVLVARNEDALRRLADEINSGSGGRAVYSVADVADEEALRRAADLAESEFGGIDTWVNNAGGSIYGRVMDVPVDDFRRLFETNFFGLINGSRIAAEHMRERGGALINLGSEVSDSPVPVQGVYSASKHAVKGFTDSFRMELEADRYPISVSLIKPTATHTPFPENAKNYLSYEPTLPPPVYAPDLVAEAILYCAEVPTREFFVGEMAKLHSSMATWTPRIGSKLMEATIDSMQNSGEPTKVNRPDGLYSTNSDLRERGRDERYVVETSPYVSAKMHPLLTAGLLLGGGVALAAWRRSSGGSDRESKSFGEGRRGKIDIHNDREGLPGFNQAAEGGF